MRSTVLLTALITLLQSNENTIFYFPQIADGGVNATTIFIANPGPPGTEASISITFTASDGSPFDITFLDNLGQQFNGAISLQLDGGSSRRLVSTASSESVQVGFATVTSDVPVTGNAVFSQYSGPPASTAILSEAAVGASPALITQKIFVDETDPFRTALALANPSPNQSANLSFDLQDTEGSTILTTTRTLEPNGHSALFVFQLFDDSPLLADHIGTMLITSSVPVATLTLRYATPLFTSLPTFSSQPWYLPPATATWQWQLRETINTGYDVGLYDIDLFDAPQATIDALQADGRRVICYFSAGSYEDFREDADQFSPADLGNTLSGFPDERWLDIRSASVAGIMRQRLDLAVEKR